MSYLPGGNGEPGPPGPCWAPWGGGGGGGGSIATGRKRAVDRACVRVGCSALYDCLESGCRARRVGDGRFIVGSRREDVWGDSSRLEQAHGKYVCMEL